MPHESGGLQGAGDHSVGRHTAFALKTLSALVDHVEKRVAREVAKAFEDHASKKIADTENGPAELQRKIADVVAGDETLRRIEAGLKRRAQENRFRRGYLP